MDIRANISWRGEAFVVFNRFRGEARCTKKTLVRSSVIAVVSISPSIAGYKLIRPSPTVFFRLDKRFFTCKVISIFSLRRLNLT